ncbi:MAG TPA: PEP-CTERM sorting domain-containing protein [Candidatus Omnitrophota bacterium]|nr:PEP-CTERM sorting domain-containing protein [Candidatus Omnitrophota bacterium]
MKKLIVFLFCAITFVLALSSSASAITAEVSDYFQIMMTNTPGVVPSVSQENFDLGEKPWLYLSFYDGVGSFEDIGFSVTGSFWTFEDSDPAKTYLKTKFGDTNDLWISFSDSYWNSIEKAGNWTVEAFSLVQAIQDDVKSACGNCCNWQSFKGEIGFKVNPVPEPISTLLFLVGGGTLFATGRLRKS